MLVMANNFLDSCYRKTKSRSRRGPFFRSWILCILVKCFISLPCIFSKCLGVDITVAVYPQNDFNVFYGEPFEVFCVAENYSSDDIEFTLGGNVMPSQRINETTRRLYIEKPHKQAVTYYCRNMKTRKNCPIRVLVDSPPENVTDFSCLSKNLEDLNCSWFPPISNSSINCSITFFINGNSVTPCIAKRKQVNNRTMYYCSWNTSSSPRYRQQEEKYYFNLKSCNVFGCNEQNFTVDHFSVVKPDPPTDLKVLSNGTHSVVLQWSIPNNVVDLLPCGVEHKIEYQIAKIDNTAYFHSVNASFLPPNNKTYKFQLLNLPYAHMQYDVRIYIKSKKAVSDDFWSEYSFEVFYTASERPGRPPEMTAGGFDQAIYNNKRVIYIYWKQLEEYEESGANFTYKVLISQGSKTQTLLADKNKSLSYVYLDWASLEAMEVSVWSLNMNGQSINSSHLYIPAASGTRSLDVTSFTKLAYENGTYELSWVGINKIDNYTLFWCQHNTTKICTGRMNFTVLEPHKHNHVINLPKDYKYQFAISANNDTKTSGMIWAKCDISKDGIAMYGFPVHLKYDAPGKSFVKLRWVMDCALQTGIITGYKITYCPVIRTSSLCDPSVGNLSVYIDDPAKMEENITGLLPFRTYQFTIALNTTYGLKTIENATAVTTTSEDTPTRPRNITISEVKSDSLVISWDPPLHRNGNIGKYVIYNYGKEYHVDKVSGTDTSRRLVTLTGLQGFTNYSWTVQACNVPIGLCSEIGNHEGIFVRTRIGLPSRLKAPTVKNNPELLKWEKPEVPGGTVDYYEVRRIKDDHEPEIMNATGLEFNVNYCEGVVASETYQVRAVNLDEDPAHGALADKESVNLTFLDHGTSVYYGEWSEPSTVACRSRDGLAMTLILMAVFALIGVVYCSIKLYKKYRKMEDIKPVLPNGLGIPEKDISKYTFSGWNPSNKDEKPSSDEVLLLPNSKTTASSADTKPKTNDNCGASDHTDSTALSDSTREPVDKQVSTPDDCSNSSIHLEVEAIKDDESIQNQEEDSTNDDVESFRENISRYVDNGFKKNLTSGYVQPTTVVNPTTGYVQSSAPALLKSPPHLSPTQPASSSYVMAGLTPPIFTTGASAPAVPNNPLPSSGYVQPEDVHSKSMVTFPELKTSPTKLLGPESLPTMPTLPPPAKTGADSSYIQLQSLDAIPSLKSSVRNAVPLKPSASNGYVSPGDVVINKHLNNMLSAGQLAEESAILDPMMSPDAYCRFSWSTDPANDNLHSLLADTLSLNTNKN